MAQKSILEFTCSHTDVLIMQRIINRLYNFSRIGIIAVCFIVMAIVMTMFISIGDSQIPILVFCWAIAFLMVLLFMLMLIKKPRLIKAVKESENHVYKMVIDGPRILLSHDDGSPIILSGRNIRNQFWRNERYFLLIDYKGYQQLLCIPVNETNFDTLFALASGLEKQNKRLLLISG